jgi:hypothetical protein
LALLLVVFERNFGAGSGYSFPVGIRGANLSPETLRNQTGHAEEILAFFGLWGNLFMAGLWLKSPA